MTIRFPADLASALDRTAADWERGDKLARLWSKDATLWTGTDEARWMGWLDVADRQRANLASLAALASEVRQAGFREALLIGMGGSSLCPEVFSRTFGAADGFPRLHVLDSVDPAQVRRVEQHVGLDRTLFIVSSKSGSTLEPNVLLDYFFDRARGTLGDGAGTRFIAVTDPGSSLERVAIRDRFWKILAGEPEIGGRFSALSNFGLVPAAVMGLPVDRLLEAATAMARRCRPEVPPADNPGAMLGLALGVAALGGFDKLTIVSSPTLASLGAWLEQLVAESTGKLGRAIIPVDNEPIAAPSAYGTDRVFVHIRFAPEQDPMQEAAIDRLAEAGRPIIRLEVSDRLDLTAEFFRWEIATAVACAVLGVNPFDQPDVEASKVATRRLTEAYERAGSFPIESPVLEDAGLRFFTDEENARGLSAAGGLVSARAALRAHLQRVRAGDYVALLAFLDMSDAHLTALQDLRCIIRERTLAATCLGFGPRFLHSTGQAYKGGPNTGVFLQITGGDTPDLTLPGRRLTFGAVKAAQSRGDLEVLATRRRRVLRVDVGSDVVRGLDTLKTLVNA